MSTVALFTTGEICIKICIFLTIKFTLLYKIYLLTMSVNAKHYLYTLILHRHYYLYIYMYSPFREQNCMCAVIRTCTRICACAIAEVSINLSSPRPVKTIPFVILLCLTPDDFTCQWIASGWERVRLICHDIHKKKINNNTI